MILRSHQFLKMMIMIMKLYLWQRLPCRSGESPSEDSEGMDDDEAENIDDGNDQAPSDPAARPHGETK